MFFSYVEIPETVPGFVQEQMSFTHTMKKELCHWLVEIQETIPGFVQAQMYFADTTHKI